MTAKLRTRVAKTSVVVDLVRRLLEEEKGIIIFYTEEGFLRLNSTIRITDDVVKDLVGFLTELIKDSNIDSTLN